MCGIAGIVNLDSRAVTVRELKNMTDNMIQRGPDDDGFFVVDSIGIGMRRLSIIDVSGGHQPLSNEDDTIHLVLNGEIYNHHELRKELVAKGHVFKTGSDAEVLIHLYEDKGVDAINDLNGMFAFALYDKKRKVTWIARDRLGIKPLFFFKSDSQLVFASDINALRAAVDARISPNQFLSYLAFGYTPNGETVWSNVRKLDAGAYFWIERNNVNKKFYWQLEEQSDWSGNLDDARQELDFLLRDSIKLQLRSDVPLGVFLSGGLDSSAIVSYASDLLDVPLHTFTIDFEGKKSDDIKYSAIVSARCKTSHIEILMGARDAITAIDELIPMLDEPIADSGMLPAYWLSKHARNQGIKVLLNGAGGDEIFGGYGRHWPSRFPTPGWVANNLSSMLRNVISIAWSKVKPNWAVRASDPVYEWASNVSGINFDVARQIVNDNELYSTMLKNVKSEYQGIYATSKGPINRYKRMKVDLHKYLPEDVLSLTDKATMAASVEGRVPLLDHRLVEFAFSLPPDINCLNHTPKGLFKDVLSSRLPQELLLRKKEGFNSPDSVWLDGRSGINLQEELLENMSPLVSEIFSRKMLEGVLRNPQHRRASASMLFGLFLLNRWLRLKDAAA